MTCLTYRKADFHVHTPVSVCYADKSVTPEQIVDVALDNGIEIMAVTDHNTFEAVGKITGAGRDKGLYVIPGIELSTKSGHFVAFFDSVTPTEELNNILAELLPDKSRWGDGTVKIEAETPDVLKFISTRGGIVVAAHIERWPSGILESGEPSRKKMEIMESPYLTALEITVPGDKDGWNNGKMGNYTSKYACIQGSDAHNLDEIGRRPVYISMEKCNMESLKAAFNDFKDKIRFPGDIKGNY